MANFFLSRSLELVRPNGKSFDILAPKTLVLRPNNTRLINTGIFLAKFSSGLYGVISSTSEWLSKGVSINSFILSCEYKREISFTIRNDSNFLVYIKEGDVVARLVFVRGV